MLRRGACCCSLIYDLTPPRHVPPASACYMLRVLKKSHSTLSYQTQVKQFRQDKQDPVTIYFKPELFLAFQLKSVSSESLPAREWNEKAGCCPVGSSECFVEVWRMVRKMSRINLERKTERVLGIALS